MAVAPQPDVGAAGAERELERVGHQRPRCSSRTSRTARPASKPAQVDVARAGRRRQRAPEGGQGVGLGERAGLDDDGPRLGDGDGRPGRLDDLAGRGGGALEPHERAPVVLDDDLGHAAQPLAGRREAVERRAQRRHPAAHLGQRRPGPRARRRRRRPGAPGRGAGRSARRAGARLAPAGARRAARPVACSSAARRPVGPRAGLRPDGLARGSARRAARATPSTTPGPGCPARARGGPAPPAAPRARVRRAPAAPRHPGRAAARARAAAASARARTAGRWRRPGARRTSGRRLATRPV